MKKKSLGKQLKEAKEKIEYLEGVVNKFRSERYAFEDDIKKLRKDLETEQQRAFHANEYAKQLHSSLQRAEGHLRGMREILKPLGLFVEPPPPPQTECDRCRRPLNPNPIDPGFYPQ